MPSATIDRLSVLASWTIEVSTATVSGRPIRSMKDLAILTLLKAKAVRSDSDE